jgi:hypothetical protein
MPTGFNFPSKDDPLEKVIERKVGLYAKSRGWYVAKWKSENNRGVLDRIFINRYGFIIFIEFKRRGKKPTKIQDECIDELEKRNCQTRVVDSIEQGKKLVDNFNTTGVLIDD